MIDSRLKSTVFNKCFNPIRIEHNNRVQYVPCGKCDACLNMRAKKLTSRLKFDFTNSRYALFFTLTYDNKHIPLVKLDETLNRWIPSYLKPCVPVTSPYSGAVHYEYPEAYMLPEEFNRDSYRPPINNMPLSNAFGCVSKIDIVRFLKRLRVNLNTMLNQRVEEEYLMDFDNLLREYDLDGVNISRYRLHKLFDNNPNLKHDYELLKQQKKEKKNVWRSQLFRYFVAAEYGPTHKDKISYHRPHYHGLLFCEDSRVLQLLPGAIRKSWKMCDKRNIDTKIVSEDRVAGYVAKYVTSNSTLPRILQTKLTRTFYLASRKSIESFREYSYEKLYNMYERGVITETKQQFERDGSCSFVDVPIPSFVLSRYFPKCREYSSLSFADKLRVYSRFFSPTSEDKRLTRDFYNDFVLYSQYKLNIYSGLNSVYRPADFYLQDITAARACERWCDYFKCSPQRYLEILDFFYYKQAMYNLEQQYLLSELRPNVVYDLSLFDDLPDVIDVNCTDDDFLGTGSEIMSLRFGSVGDKLWSMFNQDVTYFYDDAGQLDYGLLDSFMENSHSYYKDYRNSVIDDIILSDKSKKANDEYLNSLY